MGSISLPALAIRSPQNDPVADYTKAVQLKQLLSMQPGQQQLQQQQVEAGQQENQAREQQLKDQQVIPQVLAKHGGDIDAALPELSGQVAPQTFMALSKFNMERKKSAMEIDEKDRQAKLAQHDQLLGLIDQAQQIAKQDPNAYAQAYPQIAQQALAIMPELKGHIDPANPVPPQALDQFRLGIQTETTFLKKAEAARAQQASDFAAQEQPLKMAKLQDEVSQIGKKPGEDVPYSPEVFAQKKQLKASINMTTPDDLNSTVDAIFDGDASPDMTQYSYKDRTAITGRLHQRGYNLARATTDWKATQKYISTLNGSQQVRLGQAINALPDLADKIEGLYTEWTKLAPQSGVKVLNKATLAASKNLPGRAGAVAQALDAQIGDAVSDLAVVYMGGNSPTDHGLALAQKNLSADWNDETFREGLKQLKANVAIRKNSINSGRPAGTSGDNNYFTPTAQKAQPSSGMQVGQTVKLKSGKTVKVTAVHPDGSFDAQ